MNDLLIGLLLGIVVGFLLTSLVLRLALRGLLTGLRKGCPVCQKHTGSTVPADTPLKNRRKTMWG